MTDINKTNATEVANKNIAPMGNTFTDGNTALKEEPLEEVVANDNGFELPECLKNIPVESIWQDLTLSEDDIAQLKRNYANDNLPILPTDPEQNAQLWEQAEGWIKSEAALLKTLPISDEEYMRRFRTLQLAAAFNLLREYAIGQDMRSMSTAHGLKMRSKRRAKDNRRTKKVLIRQKYPHLKSRQIRDFQNLEYECVIMAIKIAFEREDVVTRSLALSAGIKKKVLKTPKATPKSLKKYYPTAADYGEATGALETEEPIYACSLFANIGIGTSLLEKNTNIKVVVANEYDKRRAQAHRRLYPNCEVIEGDISAPEVFNRVMDAAKAKGCKILLASPPCQEASQQNMSKTKGTKEKAALFDPTIKAVETGIFDTVLIENVPQWLDSSPEAGANILNGKTIWEYLSQKFDTAQYGAKAYILNSSDYGVAEARERCFILAHKKDLPEWKVPMKQVFRPTVYDAIGDLRSLGNGEVDSDFKWHYALPLTDAEINFLAHTPTGCSAWDNKAIYCPVNPDKTASLAQISRTYTRIDPAYPVATITSDSGSIAGIYTVHYGRPLTDGTYSDCRVLSILELLRLMGAEDTFLDPLDAPAKKLLNGEVDNDDFDGLTWENGRLVSADEKFIRTVLGEHVCPRTMLTLLSTMPIRPKTTAKKGGAK